MQYPFDICDLYSGAPTIYVWTVIECWVCKVDTAVFIVDLLQSVINP